MKKVKLFGVLALAALTVGVVTYTVVSANEPDAKTEAAHSDAWEAATNEANAKKAETKQDVAEVVKDEKGKVIDENYVKKEIDTPTGAEEKAKEDAYLDKAEKEVKKEVKKEEVKKEAEKNKGEKPQNKQLPKTSAVK
jgi:hypothetical protein